MNGIHFQYPRNDGVQSCTEVYPSAANLPEVLRQVPAPKLSLPSAAATSCRPMVGSCELRIASGPTSQQHGFAASPASLSERAARLHQAIQTRPAQCSTSYFSAASCATVIATGGARLSAHAQSKKLSTEFESRGGTESRRASTTGGSGIATSLAGSRGPTWPMDKTLSGVLHSPAGVAPGPRDYLSCFPQDFGAGEAW
jgi:hypothetical protein